MDPEGLASSVIQKFFQAVTTAIWMAGGGMDDGEASRPPGPSRENQQRTEEANESHKKKDKNKVKGRRSVIPDIFSIQDYICQSTGQGCLPDQYENPYESC